MPRRGNPSHKTTSAAGIESSSSPSADSSGSSGWDEEPAAQTQFVSLPDDSQELWEVVGILDESGPPRTGKYLIEWKGTDPATGHPYEPTWEKRTNVTPDVVEAWKERKKKDPSIVGKAGAELKRKFEARAKVQAEKKKRKRESDTAGAFSSKVKANATATSTRWKASKAETSAKPEAANIRRGRLHTRSASTASSSQVPGSASTAAQAQAAGARALRVKPHRPIPVDEASDSSVEVISPPPPVSSSPLKSSFKPATGASEGKGKGRPRPSVELDSRPPNGTSKPPSKGLPPPPPPPPPAVPQASVAVTVAESKSAVVPPKEKVRIDSAARRGSGPSTGAWELVSGTNTKSSGEDRPGAKDVPPPAPAPAAPTAAAKQIINLASASNSNAVAGPFTTASKIPSAKAKDLGPVPQLSPSAFHALLPSEQSSGSAPDTSVEISQIDPINEFPSPSLGNSGSGAGETSAIEVPDTQPEVEVEVEAESLPPKIVKKIIGGEEVWVAEGGSDDSDQGQGEGAVEVVQLESVDVEMDGPAKDTEELQTAEVQVDTPASPAVAVAAEVVVIEEQEVVTVERTVVISVKKELSGSNGDASFPQANGDHLTQSAPTPVTSSAPISVPDAEDSSAAITELTKQVEEQAKTIEALTKKLARANASLRSATDDSSFLREQYNTASTRAVEEVTKANVLAAEVAKLQGQLTLGLKQKYLHHAAIRKRDEGAVDRMRVTIKILEDQARLTGDRIRKNAVAYHPVKKENEELRLRLSAYEEKIARMESRNEELVDQVEMLRAKQMGVFDEVDVDGENGGDGDSIASGLSSDDGQADGQSLLKLGYDTRGDLTSSQLLPSSLDLDDGPKRKEGVKDHDGPVFACPWKNGDCGTYFFSMAEAKAHVLRHAENAEVGM